ncbi:Gfo/Idh/MocA family oxidoreductase [Paenibacillus sp. J5C_2022]|uniref:Gfo/Idh/MocA family protein n=1 Tax=Paenibacillus sp. J5C2022 TaxID=2977129 RepID=UPI0021CF0FF3|nr:Gfo/Idh/MocA family oxidoreductase [Paenibacillus sp. J5C2022]MCU6712133.1 Gfo/Idh/MocA family oxidoreductase [Paenibacillus sp. J5C2022]
MLKVGIIGCGLMGSLHARTLRQMPDVQIAALYNRSREKAEQLSAEVGGSVYDSYERLLDTDVDAVWVATPDHLHAEIAIAALEAGKHLFLEKVIATSPEDASSIVAASAKRPDLKAMTAYPLRFAPGYRKMKEILSRPDSGNVLQAWSMRTHFLVPTTRVYDKYRDHYYDTPNWYFDGSDKAGPIYSHASHDYDLLHWYGGDIESVFAYGASSPAAGGVNDAFTLAVRYTSGAIAHVSTPWVTRVENDATGVATDRLTIVNTNGELILKEDSGPEERIHFAENDMWEKLNGHFVSCIRDNVQPLVSLEDGWRAIAVSEAAIRSLRERREVAVDYGPAAGRREAASGGRNE